MSSGGDGAAPDDRHALSRHRLLLHDEGDEPKRWASLLDPAQLGDAGELLVQRARPAEAGRDRIGLGGDVVAMQRIADLEAQRVTRAEAAGDGAARDHRVPESAGVLGCAHQLAARLARIAGAADHHLDAVELPHRVGERGRRGKPEPLQRPRALNGEERVLV